MGDKLSRKEAKERTRQRLLDAVLDHVREHGLHGLTTGRVADAAGIAQSSFYVHFKDMDDALRAAAEHAGEELRGIVRGSRLELDYSKADAAYYAAYESAIDALLLHRAFTELLLAHRRDRNSPLAESLRAAIDRARTDLARDLTETTFAAWFAADIDAYAELMVGMTLTAVEAIVDGRRERGAMIRACAHATRKLLHAALPDKTGAQS